MRTILLCWTATALLFACGGKDKPATTPDTGDSISVEAIGGDQQVCYPDCQSKVCGPDGCGGSCGECGAALNCSQGACQEGPCIPDCQGKVCGDDGCGGSCGTCPVNVECEFAEDGTAACGSQDECPAFCDGEGWECGALEFSQEGQETIACQCGECPVGDVCKEYYAGSYCCTPACIEDDFEKECGDDGCGGVCGVCPPGAECVTMSCTFDEGYCFNYEEECPDICDWQEAECGEVMPAVAEGSPICDCGACPDGLACVETYDEDGGNYCCTVECDDKECGDDGCGGYCGFCTEPEEVCVAGTCVCQPKCEGKECGPDGCGGSCGACGPLEKCTPGGDCIYCLPDCEGKVCGDDGCGESCGSCGAGEYCSAGICSVNECAGLADLTGTVYRLTGFQMSKPTDKLNEAWGYGADPDILVVLLEVVTHDVPNKTLVLKMGPGAANTELVGDVPTLTELHFALEPSEFPASLQGCDVVFGEPFSLPLATSDTNKPFPVAVLNGQCSLTFGGTQLSSGQLSGVVPEAEIVDFCMAIPGMGVANMHWFFNLAKICPSVDSDNSGIIDSYEFAAEFQGEPTDLLQSGIEEVPSDVAQCSLHDDPCIE